MQKRRLSPLARIVFHVLNHCTAADSPDPVVFSSYMGEIKRTQEILDTLACAEPVSPASFSLSVHNAISGLWSLIHDNKTPMVALAPTGGSPVAALIEAAGILAETKHDAAIVVIYEEDYPPFYEPFLKGPAAPYALALRLIPPGANPDFVTADFKLGQFPAGDAAPLWQNNLDLIDVLTGDRGSVVIAEPQCSWCLERGQ